MAQKRDRELTEQKILDAVSRIVLKEGIKKLGVNSIAREAGIDKVLIYRYFGGFAELFKVYIKKQDFFANLKEYLKVDLVNARPEEMAEAAKKIHLLHLNYARTNKEFQEVLLWELNNNDEITEFIANEREQIGNEITKIFKEKYKNTTFDLEVISSIITCAINHLVLRARHVDVYNGLDLQDEKSWRRFENTIEQILEIVQNTVVKN
ncbi:MAG: TetR/AcrR family transcriptional regulator [Rhodothermaceae bacterium]